MIKGLGSIMKKIIYACNLYHARWRPYVQNVEYKLKIGTIAKKANSSTRIMAYY